MMQYIPWHSGKASMIFPTMLNFGYQTRRPHYCATLLAHLWAQAVPGPVCLVLALLPSTCVRLGVGASIWLQCWAAGSSPWHPFLQPSPAFSWPIWLRQPVPHKVHVQQQRCAGWGHMGWGKLPGTGLQPDL